MSRVAALLPARRAALILVAALVATTPLLVAQDAGRGWVAISYGELVDGRALSQSGELVGDLIERLGGRPVPAAGGNVIDRVAHMLLDPVLEPYSFLLPDALDTGRALDTRPFVDVGRLYAPGEARPAWADLLRDGKYVVESDGAGRVRAFVPVADARASSADAARDGWREAWPVLRHVLASVAAATKTDAGLDVTVYPFVHRPARTELRLGFQPHSERVSQFAPDGRRPPLDLAAWRSMIDDGMQIEGGRLDEDGRLTLMASRPAGPPELAGRPLTLADVAVAYRAIFHAPGDEPYMSLDRARWPHLTRVNYGGRLGDTALGLVSLLCDVRFKTFSVGRDIERDVDVREEVRAVSDDFATHLERFARDPAAAQVSGQQTRLWFYPDSVDMTLSPAGDLMALRRARMSAASERVDPNRTAGTTRPDPPWTRETVRAIDVNYDLFAKRFPEMGDLDQVVRLLSLFSWLRAARDQGAPLPDLDALLAESLPDLATPRMYPQLLSFNALPPSGQSGAVEVLSRADVVEALDRMRPEDGRALEARVRFERARARLDAKLPEHRRLLEEMSGIDAARADAARLGSLAHRADRLAMHRLVLATLPLADRQRLGQRQLAEGRLRVFSIGIGGLDLSMARAVRRGSGRAMTPLFGLGAPRAVTRPQAATPPASSSSPRRLAAAAVREEWRVDPEGLSRAELPRHGLAADPARRELPGGTLRGTSRGRHHVARGEVRGEPGATWVETVYDPGSPDVSARRVVETGKARVVTRREGERLLRYAFVSAAAGSLTAKPRDRLLAQGVAAAADRWFEPAQQQRGSARDTTQGMARLTLAPAASPTSANVAARFDLASGESFDLELPREALARAARGPSVASPREEPPAPLVPLPDAVGSVERLLVSGTSTFPQGWSSSRPPRAGEESAAHLAAGLAGWFALDDDATVSVGVAASGEDAARRSALAITDRDPAMLVMAPGVLSGRGRVWRQRLIGDWTGPTGASPAAARKTPRLVVVVSDEAPATLTARLAEMARTDAMKGRVLVVCTLGRPLRSDLPARLLAASGLAGVGMLEAGPTGLDRTVDDLLALAAGAATAPEGRPFDGLSRRVVWYF